MRLLRTIGGIDFTGQERAAHNKLTMPNDEHQRKQQMRDPQEHRVREHAHGASVIKCW